MNRVIIIIIILLMFVSTSIIAGPQLTIKEPTFNFGFVPQKSKITYPFWLYSTGDEPLKILKVVPGWGCTKAPLDKSELTVGDSTKLEITFDTGNFRRRTIKRPRLETNEGPLHKYLKIISDIMVHPDSSYPVTIVPYKLNTKLLTLNSSNELEFKINNVSESIVSLSKIYVPDQYYTVILPKKIEPGETKIGKIKLTVEGNASNFENSFTILADNGRKFRFTIPVTRTK